MSRTALWKSIEETLTAQIAGGEYGAGDKLPTESALATRFGVNRHTVRRALAGLADNGIVLSRRGAGVFVAQAPTVYPIGRRVRFHQNLTASGQIPAKEILTLETRIANAAEREALALEQGAEVHVYEGLSLADGNPIALFRSVFPAAPLPNLLADLNETRSVTNALERAGVADYTRKSTSVVATLATATQALHLKVNEHAPILRTVGINIDAQGTPIELGHTWFAGDRVTLTVTDEGDDQRRP